MICRWEYPPRADDGTAAPMRLLPSPALTASLLAASALPRAPTPRLAVWDTFDHTYDNVQYSAKIQSASPLTGSAKCPPIVCIPPLGVGITRRFYEPLHREWAALGAPGELHTPELCGNGDSKPKRRRFYTPEVWADQLLDYCANEVKRPCILVVQGGLLPVALEMWKKGGSSCIAGVSFVAPPALRFFKPDAQVEPGVRKRFQNKGTPGRRTQRLLWLAAQSPVGNGFFRYLRFGKGQPRIRSFSERNLFAEASNVDDEWMRMCYDGSRDARSRFATLAYLVGTVPGGTWRDDRSGLLDSLTVPTQVLRGDYVPGAEERLKAFVDAVPQPSTCKIIPGGRAVLPFENANAVAVELLRFCAANYDASIEQLVPKSRPGSGQ